MSGQHQRSKRVAAPSWRPTRGTEVSGRDISGLVRRHHWRRPRAVFTARAGSTNPDNGCRLPPRLPAGPAGRWASTALPTGPRRSHPSLREYRSPVGQTGQVTTRYAALPSGRDVRFVSRYVKSASFKRYVDDFQRRAGDLTPRYLAIWPSCRLAVLPSHLGLPPISGR
jgi:hypothetical protein